MSDGILKVIWAIGFIAGSVIRGLYTRGYRQARIAHDHKTRLDMLLLILTSIGMIVLPLLYVITPWLNFADYHLPRWAGWIGVAIFAIGLWLLWRSHADLGRNWSPTLQIAEGHSLVTQGVYHFIRHPMYAAHGLWGIAHALLLQNFLAGLAMLASLLPLFLYRIPREEQMMHEHFGEAYRLYMQQTGRFIPRLRR